MLAEDPLKSNILLRRKEEMLEQYLEWGREVTVVHSKQLARLILNKTMDRSIMVTREKAENIGLSVRCK